MKEYSFKVLLRFQTDSRFTPEELVTLFLEQWEQTGAAMEGDIIDRISVEEEDNDIT